MIVSLRSLLTLGSSTLLLLASCGGGDADEAGEVTPPGDTTAPFTVATPGTGLYPAHMFVSLAANEPSTIYYTTDGTLPTVGGVTTIAGASPVSNIWLNHPLTLRYFAVDLAENHEVPGSSTYNFDLNPPIVSILNPPIGFHGFLEIVEFGVLSNEVGSYLIEFGGTGEPGTGTALANGSIGANVLVDVEFPSYRLDIGQQSPGNPIYVHVADVAGGVTSILLHVRTEDDLGIPVAGTTEAIELTADGRFGYLLIPDLGELRKFDTDLMSPTFNTVLAAIPIGAGATHMDITADSTRVYVALAAGFAEVNVATDALISLPMPGGLTPSGLAIHDAEEFALIAASDGSMWQLDVMPSSPNYQSVIPLSISEPSMTSGSFFMTPDQTHTILVWTSATDFGVQHINTDPAALFGWLGTPTVLLEGLLPAIVGDVAFRADSQTGWTGNENSLITPLNVGAVPPVAGTSSPSNIVAGITTAPDDSVLLLTGGATVGIRFADPNSLLGTGFLASGGAGSGTTSRAIRFSADGERAYLVRDNGLASAEIWVLER